MINTEITRAIKAIKQDKKHGATWLSQQALRTLILATQKSQAKTTDQFFSELKEIVFALIEAKPTMASIINYSCQFLYEVTNHSPPNLDSLKAFAQAKGEEIIEASKQARLKIAELGANLIQPSDTVMTCSYSSTVCQALQIAKQKGKNFKIIIAQSKSPYGILYGKSTAKELKKQAIPSELIEDKDIEKYIHHTTKVLIGADSILSDGSVINGTPSYSLASAAASIPIPVYSLGETAKLDIQSYKGKLPTIEPGFDKIPPQLITGIITELGIIEPRQVINYVKKTRTLPNLLTLNL